MHIQYEVENYFEIQTASELFDTTIWILDEKKNYYPKLSKDFLRPWVYDVYQK